MAMASSSFRVAGFFALASGAIRAVPVAIEQLAFRAGLEAPDKDDGDPHGTLRPGAARLKRKGTLARSGPGSSGQ